MLLASALVSCPMIENKSAEPVVDEGKDSVAIPVKELLVHNGHLLTTQESDALTR